MGLSWVVRVDIAGCGVSRLAQRRCSAKQVERPAKLFYAETNRESTITIG